MDPYCDHKCFGGHIQFAGRGPYLRDTGIRWSDHVRSRPRVGEIQDQMETGIVFVPMLHSGIRIYAVVSVLHLFWMEVVEPFSGMGTYGRQY